MTATELSWHLEPMEMGKASSKPVEVLVLCDRELFGMVVTYQKTFDKVRYFAT